MNLRYFLLVIVLILSVGCATTPQPLLGSSEIETEVASQPTEGERASLEGVYKASGGEGSYSGVVRITRMGGAYLVEWNIFPNETYTGIGLHDGDTLSVAIRSPNDPNYLAVIVYRITNKTTLEGRWSVLGNGSILDETLVFESALPENPDAI